MATTRIKDLSKTATTVNADANLVLDGNTGGTQKITRDNFRQDTADAFVAAPGTYNLAPINSGTGKIDATYLPTSSDTPKGAWNASTNTPTLADGSGTAGDYYDVTVAGSSDLGSGSITFTVGDVVKYDGTTWFKIDSVTNILDGVSTIDGAKAAIEIPDVGTDPSEVPLNQHLGSMAYQSADSVAMGKAEIESTTGTATTQALTVTDGTDTNFVVQEGGNVGVGLSSPSGSGWDESATVLHVKKDDTSGGLLALESSNTKAILNAGNDQLAIFTTTADPIRLGTSGSEAIRIDSSQRVGINQTSPGSYHSYAYDLVVGDATGNRGITISSSSSGAGNIHFADGTTGTDRYRGYIGYDQTSDTMSFGTAATTKWQVNSSGNLVAYLAGAGIDFGAVASGTGTVTPTTGGLLDDFESGTWTPADGSGAGLTFTYAEGTYIKVGGQVTCWARIEYPVTSDTTAAAVQGFPFPFGGSTVDRVGGPVVYTNYGEYISVLGVNSQSKIQIFRTTGSGPTNANLSGKQVWFTATYNVS